MISTTTIHAQQIIPLYEKVPNSIFSPLYQKEYDTVENDNVRNVSNPTVEIFYPNSAINNHTAIIICPGGGYKLLAYDWEGISFAKTLVKWGITAIVLKYRLPSDSIMKDKTIGPLQDAQRAIQLIRINCKKWGIDENKIGIMGFSAGGHLAATASTRFDAAVIENPDHISLRPDFSVLAYPVISMRKPYTHTGSHENLLGKNPSETTEDFFSAELQVTSKTPPAFLVLAQDDKTVNPENSIMYFQALTKNKVSSEIHIYQSGGHGFGQDAKRVGGDWMEILKHWFEHNHYINPIK
ncbi:MAG: alpha/beta hydrolase [Arachidicoccus sp.]|nr:alpha/beta hydrolase [Arachidicoccus sp.]